MLLTTNGGFGEGGVGLRMPTMDVDELQTPRPFQRVEALNLGERGVGRDGDSLPVHLPLRGEPVNLCQRWVVVDPYLGRPGGIA